MIAARSLAATTLAGSILILAVSTASSQDWAGDHTVHGVVTDTDKQPIEGATVELRWAKEPSAGPAPTRTDSNGRWRFLGLGRGHYELEIRASGFINVNGLATVSGRPRVEPIEAQMLPLSWEPPRFSEGSAHTMRLWIEKGNSLLEQGQPGAAREQYERALAHLPAGRQPQVLRGIARTFYLEDRPQPAIESLQRALEIAPEEETTRQLFLLLMENQGRRHDGIEFLAQIDARPRTASEEPEPGFLPPEPPIPEDVRALLEAPPDLPRPHRVGRYKTTFGERSPWSRLDIFVQRLGSTREDILARDPSAGSYDISEESFELLVPQSYAPGGDWGLLVWISPTPFGGTRSPEMAAALSHHRLIWIGANRSGNRRWFWDRMWLALDAAHNARSLYDVDPRRIYVAGYSGGGRLASQIAVLFPEVVRGTLALYGCDYYERIPVVERPGTSWPAKYQRPSNALLDPVKRDSRFVLVTGPRDFNFTQVRSTAAAMGEDGFQHVTYLEIPDADHYTFPDAIWLDRIFAALDPDDL